LIYTYIAPFRRRAMKRARIERGQRVLHIGCGAGEITFEMRVGWAALAW
jgi:ubiquinone/menaquinone biosynthesis C-methylase UbiE